MQTLNGYVQVEIKDSTKTKGGLLVPLVDNSVVSGNVKEDYFINCDGINTKKLQIGDVVLFKNYAPAEYFDGEKKHHFVLYKDIIAVL